MSSRLESFLRRHPVFTRVTFDTQMSQGKSVSPHTLRNMLAQHLQRGHIVRIRRGLYAAIPRGADPEKYSINPYLIAGFLADDAVLAYHTALSFYGVAHSVSYRFIYLTREKPKPMTFREEMYQPTSFPRALIQQKKTHCYVNQKDVQGLDIRVTSKERTLVDVLDRPSLGGSWEEIWRSLDNFDYLNINDIVEYVLMLDNATTVAKVGFYLEQRKQLLKIEPRHFDILLKQIPASPHYMVNEHQGQCRYIKNWNLMVPVALINRDWEEDLNWEPET